MVSRTFALCAVVSVWLLPVSAIGNDLVPILHDSRHTVFLDSARGALQIVPSFSRTGFLSEKSPAPLWQLRFRTQGKNLITLSPRDRPVQVRKTSRTVDLLWSDIPLEGKKIRVKMTGQLKAKSLGMSFWKIDVENATPFSLWSLDFPGVKIQGDPQGRDILAIPLGNGLAVQNPSHNKGLVAMRAYFGTNIGGAAYPCGLQTMQFATYYRDGRGLLVATFDSDLNGKLFAYEPDPAQGCLGVVVSPQLPNMGVAGHSYHQSYEAVLGVYQGDWYDACQIYRAWAVHQVWCAKGPLYQRTDVPEWFRKAPVGLIAYAAPKSALTLPNYTELWVQYCLKRDPNYVANYKNPDELLLAYKQALGNPSSVSFQWYVWGIQTPWLMEDIRWGQTYHPEYPEVAPHREVPAEAVTMKQAGIHPIAYINAHLWEPQMPSYQQAQAWTAKDETGKPIDGEYNKKPNGDFHIEPSMCPSTSWYQDRMVELLTKLVKDVSFDGLYLDQLTAVAPMRCFDATHGHPVGGGNHWVQGYRQLLTKLRARVRQVNPQIVLTSETVAEPYIDLLDGNLSYTPGFGGGLPLYKTVYGDYAIMYYRKLTADILEKGLPFRQGCGEMFVNGEVLGGFGAFQIAALNKKYAVTRDYLKTLIQAFQYAQPFLIEGQMLRPLVLRTQNPDLSFQDDLGGVPYTFKTPPVLNRVYRTYDHRLGIVLTNYTDQAQQFGFRVNLKEYGFSGKNLKRTTWENGKTTVQSQEGLLAIQRELAPRSALVYVMEAEPAGQ